MDLRPADIAMRQFTRKLRGVDSEEVKLFLVEVAATLERINSELTRVTLERTELQASLKKAIAEAEDLKKQLANTQEKITAHHKQENQMAQALLSAQKATDDLIQSSKGRADRIVTEAKASALLATEAARKEAAEAKTQAQTIVEAARKEAAELLRTTQAQAQEAVKAAERAAETRMAQAQRDAELMMEEARHSVAEIQQTALQQVEQFMTNIKAFMSNWEGLSRSLEVLARDQAEALETIAGTRAEVESDVLPLLRDLLRGLRAGADIGLREPAPAAAPSPPPPPLKPAAPPARPAVREPAAAPSARPAAREPAAASHSPTPPQPAPPPKSVQPVRPSPAPAPERVPVGAAQAQGEIVVSPVGSYLQASRLVTAVSKIKGVKTARLRAYSKGMITIDVLTEEGTLAGIGADLSTGFPVDVVEETDTRLVLRFANGRVQAPTQVTESSE